MFRTMLFHLLLLLSCSLLHAQSTMLTTNVLVIGGGTGGTAAGIQSARSGVSTIIAEPTNMLGGMLTAAGVSCTDGNDALNSGMWQAFREALYHHYQTTNLASGWVSETCFEPHVGDSIFKAWAAKERNLRVLYGYTFIRVLKKGHKVTGAVFKNKRAMLLTVYAAVTIDATELGDVLANAGATYDLGMDDAKTSGEKQAGGKNNIIQDLTWTAVLKDYGAGASKIIDKPAVYHAADYYCCCTNAPCNETPYKVNALAMLDYAKLPGNKYMLNWPAHGNDSYLNVVEENNTTRNLQYEIAKNHTRGFIYFIQTQLGMKNLGLATDELDSGMAIIPYHREGRRVKGVARLNIHHISNPYAYTLYRTGIAVGDYPVDHHHGQYPGGAPVIDFPKIPSYNVPMGTLIPLSTDGLIVCEKGISVSNIVNGTTRLQPVVLLAGQAAGVLAAVSIQKKIAVRKVPARTVQAALLALKCYIMPYADVKPDNPYWQAIQRTGATGILKGTGKAAGWANKTYFYPDSTITVHEFETGLHDLYSGVHRPAHVLNTTLTIDKALQILMQKKIFHLPHPITAACWSNELHLDNFTVNRPIKRFELAVMLDYYGTPFTKIKVDMQGKPIPG